MSSKQIFASTSAHVFPPLVVAVANFEKLVREVRIPARGPGLEIARGKSPRSKLFHVPLGENEQKLSKNVRKCANGKFAKDEMANLIRAQSVHFLKGILHSMFSEKMSKI